MRAPAKRSPRVADKKVEKRAGERVFDVAADLFYREGIRSVGVETIVQRAGVAKISLYRSFASKDDLIAAYLENRNAEYWRLIDQLLAKHKGDARAQLRALIAYIADRTTAPGYRGCPFINYAAEFPDPSHPGHRVAAANKQEMRRRLVELIGAAGIADAARLADAFMLLIDGAYASSQTLGGPKGPAAVVPWAASALIESQLNRSTGSRTKG
jgi:AcrR family transcriptional regulator